MGTKGPGFLRFGKAGQTVEAESNNDAMSATPVPRTLQLSLAGVRDMSVIETPPKDRMAVETAILPFSREVIREAIEYELERGGQVYYVYNRVESIEEVLHVNLLPSRPRRCTSPLAAGSVAHPWSHERSPDGAWSTWPEH